MCHCPACAPADVAMFHTNSQIPHAQGLLHTTTLTVVDAQLPLATSAQRAIHIDDHGGQVGRVDVLEQRAIPRQHFGLPGDCEGHTRWAPVSSTLPQRVACHDTGGGIDVLEPPWVLGRQPLVVEDDVQWIRPEGVVVQVANALGLVVSSVCSFMG